MMENAKTAVSREKVAGELGRMYPVPELGERFAVRNFIKGLANGSEEQRRCVEGCLDDLVGRAMKNWLVGSVPVREDAREFFADIRQNGTQAEKDAVFRRLQFLLMFEVSGDGAIMRQGTKENAKKEEVADAAGLLFSTRDLRAVPVLRDAGAKLGRHPLHARLGKEIGEYAMLLENADFEAKRRLEQEEIEAIQKEVRGLPPIHDDDFFDK